MVTDLFPFHLQARKVRSTVRNVNRQLMTSLYTFQLNIWTMGFIVSPFLSPFMMGFIVARIECVKSRPT